MIIHALSLIENLSFDLSLKKNLSSIPLKEPSRACISNNKQTNKHISIYILINRNDKKYLLDDPAFVVACSEIVEVDNVLDVGLHVADELELNIGLEKRARDVVEAIVEDFLVDDRRIAHLLKSTRNAPS